MPVLSGCGPGREAGSRLARIVGVRGNGRVGGRRHRRDLAFVTSGNGWQHQGADEGNDHRQPHALIFAPKSPVWPKVARVTAQILAVTKRV